MIRFQPSEQNINFMKFNETANFSHAVINNYNFIELHLEIFNVLVGNILRTICYSFFTIFQFIFWMGYLMKRLMDTLQYRCFSRVVAQTRIILWRFVVCNYYTAVFRVSTIFLRIRRRVFVVFWCIRRVDYGMCRLIIYRVLKINCLIPGHI